jgi:hypothetical protein
MPPWGRPPSGRRGRERWERERLMYEDALRFQELDSEDDASGNHGVPASVFKQSNRSVSDELFFNDGASRYPRQSYSDEHLAYGERYESPEEESDEDVAEAGSRPPPSSLVRRDSDQIIAQRALERIDRAKAKGKASVNLTHEEIEALEKRYTRPSSDSPDRERRGSGDKASKRRSPSGSNGAWTRKRGSRRSSLIAPSNALAPAKQRTKESRKKQAPPPDETYPAGGQVPPVFMTMGPGGVPVYSPLGYYNAQPPARRSASDGNRYSPPPRSDDSSRSTSASSRRGQPVYDGPPYPSSRNSNARPASMHIEAEYWPPPHGQYQAYNLHDARRVASNSPNVAYSNVYRRMPPAMSARGRMQPSTSDPALHYSDRGPSGLGNEYEPSSETSDEDEDDESDEDELAQDPTYVEDRRRRRPVSAAVTTAPVSRPRRRR